MSYSLITILFDIEKKVNRNSGNVSSIGQIFEGAGYQILNFIERNVSIPSPVMFIKHDLVLNQFEALARENFQIFETQFLEPNHINTGIKILYLIVKDTGLIYSKLIM